MTENIFKPMRTIYFILLLVLISGCFQNVNQAIDRFQLVNRHNITIEKPDPLASLSVGNGEFAFTADITGLQTFPKYYEKGVSLGTQSQWGWHSLPNVNQYTLDEVYKYYQVGNKQIPYIYRFSNTNTRKDEASEWLRENPHRLHLGLIGLELIKQDSTQITIHDIKNPIQNLNLWTGKLKSHFQFEGTPVDVEIFCHQELDMLSVVVKSPLIRDKKLRIKFNFPYGAIDQTCPGYDFEKPNKHTTTMVKRNNHRVTLERHLDTTRYYIEIEWEQTATIQNPQPHQYVLIPSDNERSISLSCLFSQEKYEKTLPVFNETEENNRKAWKKFWMSGGAVDFSECTDPRAIELERRVLLSQYLTKIQSSGSLPPQETGLTFNSWYGKFHLEMHWWHVAHFIAWNRPNLMEEQLDYYSRIIKKAKHTAQHQGYQGVRWPKMTDFSGTESPSTVGTFLIWQQPHVIYFTEMLYQLNHKTEVLDRYKDLVFDTADFMASYARWDSSTHRYVLGPALIPAQEVFAPETTINPPFELAYWYWGLQTAQNWRKRLGMEENPLYRNVLEDISPLPKNDSLYIFAKNRSDSYHNPECLRDHPIVLGAYGFVPPHSVSGYTIF